MATRRAALVGFTALAACKPQAGKPRLQDGESQRVTLPNGGHAWLSKFDITKTAIDHIIGEAIGGVAVAGDYYPASKSPAFTRVDAQAVLRRYRLAHAGKAIALINSSFFERYDAATELSFPLKRVGKVITGGSSPYGPRTIPADARYKNVILKALVWSESAIKLVDYDHKTGGVLNDAAFPDGFVTYDYVDHPANVLTGDPVGQYQLMGLLAAKDQTQSKVLVVLTVVKGRMVEGAAVLQQNGVNGTVLTVDGGPSTHLWSSASGTMIATQSTSLPHFLGFRSRDVMARK